MFEAILRLIAICLLFGSTNTVLAYIPTYNTNGNTTQTTDPWGFVVSTEYDGHNHANKRTTPDGISTLGFTRTGQPSYIKDAAGRIPLSNTYAGEDRLLTHTDGLGRSTTYGYDSNGNTLQHTLTYTGITGPSSTITAYEYDALNRLSKTIEAKDTTSERHTTYDYDKVGNRIAEHIAFDTEQLASTLSYGYDARNRLINSTDALGNSSSQHVDATGNVVQQTDRRDETSHFVYDALNRQTQQTDALNHTQTTAYDAVGNATKTTNQRGYATAHEYDGINRLLTSTHNNTNIVRVTNTYPIGSGHEQTVTDANGHTTTHAYDWRGNITQSTYADGSRTQNNYDASGYLTQSIDEAGYNTTYSYYDDGSIASSTNAEAETTAYGYDIYGNIAQTTQPLGNITQHSYNALSQLIQVDKSENYSARYTYDLNGNLRHQTTPAANDSGESHVEYQYDKNHRRIAHIQTTHSDPISTTYSYDAEGLMLTKTDANGELFEYRYDALGRLSEATIPAGNQADINTIATEYDANHNITEVVEHKTSGTETTTFTYDSLERQTQQIQRGYAVNYDYDDVGNRTEVATSGGSTDYSFNSRNRLSNATSNNQATAYTYLANGWQQSVSYPNNTETLITYDQVGRSTQLINQHNTQGILSQYDYAYDSNGNRTTQTENQQGFAAQQQQTTTYGYDGLDRLTSTDIEDSDSGANTLTEYGYYPSYDRASQTITHTDAQGTDLVSLQREYLYDELHRLTQINNTLNSSNISYNYDNNGNTLSKTDNSNSDTTQFSYNSRNQLKAVNKNGSNQGQYDYNYAGLRISNGGSNRGNINYYHDGLTVIDETSNGSPYAHYNYANRLISLSTPSDTQYYHFSALNTTANLTNSNGDIQASYRTDVFGDITEQQGQTENRHVFTGHEHDTETDLIYMKARYYDPDAGRFLQQDSYLGEAGTPPSLHRYVYAYGNPTVYTDPTGNYPETEMLADYLSEKADAARSSSDSLDDGVLTSTAGFFAGIGSGILDLASLGVEGVNQGLNVAVDNIYDESSTNARVTSSRRDMSETVGELKATGQAIKQTAQLVVEDPTGAGAKVIDATKQFGSDLARGDAGAFANLGTAVGVPIPGAVGIKATQNTIKAAKAKNFKVKQEIRQLSQKGKEEVKVLKADLDKSNLPIEDKARRLFEKRTESTYEVRAKDPSLLRRGYYEVRDMLVYKNLKGRRDFDSFKESIRSKISKESGMKRKDIPDDAVYNRMIGSSSKGNAAIDAKYLRSD